MFFSALALGFLGSFHCIGMCGPIAFMLPVDRANPLRKALQIAAYHFGRLLTYAIIGTIFGVIGKQFYLFGFQQQLSIVIGILMILIGLVPQVSKQSHRLSKPLYGLVTKLKIALGKTLKKKTPDAFLTIGFLNGFLPCGLVYMAVFGATTTQSPLLGGAYMGVFGLGTIPLMTATVYLGQFLKAHTRQKIQRIIPVAIILIGLLFILRGLGLGIPYISPTPVHDMVPSGMNCH